MAWRGAGGFGRWSARLLVAAVLFLGAAEVAVRVARPAPRVQVIREDLVAELREVHGVPVWRIRHPEVLRDGCAGAPERAGHVAFIGSSIFRGSGVEGPEVFSEVLRRRHEGSGRWCFENHAEPAFTGPQKAAVALALLDRERPPDVLIWEVWENDPGTWRLADGRAVNLRHHTLDPVSGAPVWGPVRGGLAAALFDHSAAWRYAVLTFAGGDVRPGPMMARSLQEDLLPVVSRARERGVGVVLVVMPDLGRPFAEAAARPMPAFAPVPTFATAHGLPIIDVAAGLDGQDVEALRHDPCCHYSAAGHQALADLFDRLWFGDAPERPLPLRGASDRAPATAAEAGVDRSGIVPIVAPP